ncbi:PAS domain S-box protein [Acetobacteraceae bacterium KSS8]|uniref:histidine kinase n=1 Tax=Endosaccharibacter trunci TaxID=2812733 RepID=A0ABT1W6V1_9PROT|nr:PAS domain S-box protein [Acetobacteraceae bacterium KSS8]
MPDLNTVPNWTEAERLRALYGYNILDTAREAEFDDITQMASQACGTSISLLNLIDSDRQWFKAETGFGARQIPREPSLCLQALSAPDVLMVPDTRADPRFDGHPMVYGPPFARLYAGVPLRTPDGLPIGVLCVMDRTPGILTEQQLFILKALARAVMARLEQRKALAERDQALLAERRSQSHSRQILDSAVDYAIISFDLEGRVTSWNEGAHRILGWTEPEMLGQPADRIFTPEDVASGRPAKEMGDALRHGRGNDERWHVRKDGSRFFASGEMLVLRDETGAFNGFIKMLRDRTEQRSTSEALRFSEDRIETALSTGLVGFFDWNVSTDTVQGDARYAELFGLDPVLLAKGLPLYAVMEAIHPADRHAMAATLGEAIGLGTDYTCQCRIVGKGVGGERKPRSLLIRGRCYERAGSQARRFTGIAIDISATEEARAALHASESFNREILASSSDCIKVLSLDGALDFMSEGGQRIMEIADFSRFAGCPWPSFWKGSGNVEASRAIETARNGGRAHFRGYADTALGNQRYWDVVVTPMLGRDGKPERLLSISRDVTEAHAATERIELALNTGAVLGTWVWDVPRDRFTADRRFAATFSLQAETLAAGLPLKEVIRSIHPDDLARVEAQVGRVLAEGGRYSDEYRVRQLDGSWRWIEANGTCDLDEAGEAARFPGVVIDIDARKRQELRQAALIDLGNGLRELKEPAAMMDAASRLLGRTLGVDRAGYGVVDARCDLILVERDWCAGPSIRSFAGTHNVRSLGFCVEDMRRNEVVAISDVFLDPRTSDGAAALAAAQIRGVLSVPLIDTGAIRAIVFAHTDDVHAWTQEEISFARAVADRTWAAIEQARAENELLRINQGLEAEVSERTRERDGIWTVSRDLLGVADQAGVWLNVSPAWTEQLGWPSSEIVGHGFGRVAHPDDSAHVAAEIARIAAQRESGSFEARFRTASGDFRALSWVVVPAENRLYCSARDVTEARQAAISLARTEQALRQSQKMEAVGQLTGGLAHDFNNLLTGISGALELLGTRVAQGRYNDVDRYVQAAQGAARRAAALTHRLLAFSRQQTLDPKPTDTTRLVADMEELIRRTIGPEIELTVNAAPGTWAVLVDPNQLENAVLNLCLNARDAMPDGGRLCIEMTNLVLASQAARDRDMQPGEYVSLCVADTGTGMRPDVIAKAFDPFFTTKPLGQGTGLGLSMIYGFARQSGGQIRIQSKEGVGTRMHLLLPRHAGAVGDVDAESARGDAPRAAAGETVLIVDDEPTIRMLIVEVLEELDYAAVEAQDGSAGLAVLQSGARIDLLVTDVGLPGGMNGRQMADIARRSRPGLKVLFITGYAENAVVGNGDLEPGMHVMTKPFAMDVLASRIKELTTGR